MLNLGGSLRQSPPPVVDAGELIPKGAMISPPESGTSGSDEDEPPEIKNRRAVVLKDLREAVSQMSNATTLTPRQSRHVDAIPPSLRGSFSTSALSEIPMGGRKNGHMRSSTEPHASALKKQSTSSAASEEEADDDLKFKPQMVRKKSGELVRPALRGHRRPSSVPGTPVFSKAVHFDSHLEHVRHFLQVDRPLAVSAGSSPADNYDGSAEYPFLADSRGSKALPFEWELATPNFPHDCLVRKTMPVRLEKVWLSNDHKSLLGSITVSNLAFHKSVVCRFTMDYWKTVSEVSAEYSHEIRPRHSLEGHDRFTFAIKLSDMADLESKTLFFCIRYTVNGQEYWDNNSSTNFQVDFKKKYLQQNGKQNFQGASSKPLNGLPRSNRRVNGPSTARPLSLPASLDAFGNAHGVFKFDQPIHEYLGESDTAGGLRFKSKSSSSLASDNISKAMVSPSGVAFSNRYDFGASLSAAVKAAKDTTSNLPKSEEMEKDTLYMKSNVRGSESLVSLPFSGGLPSGPDSPVSSLPSASYEELVNKYCFFGSAAKQTSAAVRNGTRKPGAMGEVQGGDYGTGNSSPVDSPAPRHHAGEAAHHSLSLGHMKPFLPSFSSPPPGSAASTAGPKMLQDSISAAMAPCIGRSTPPALLSGSGTPASDGISERFPWTTETHSATAIHG
ncbi:uncharacterized protein MAM_05222 [Metarhizium album ARSEF 1941]|uniref:CBM21 domain-containing protein n=1 Tax=Metarhizium album (strain ARSEF 1941) TaxID=1081103 RepID=A0A0B2WSV3_METAS|nr:uncharacterized protein MAM_05222 [Metarhizium album ARSEF 1941]KHN97113.1 hypothetical protein MAM_05222 [Metarhizium album ARSEF 1941]